MFARPPGGVPGVLVITPGRGLVDAEDVFTLKDLLAVSQVPVESGDLRYRRPLQRDARRLAATAPGCQFVLLGSISTRKYADVLLPFFSERLLFPKEFVGRCDMSRGCLMLRSAQAGQELDYAPLAGAVIHGKRPPRLK